MRTTVNNAEPGFPLERLEEEGLVTQVTDDTHTVRQGGFYVAIDELEIVDYAHKPDALQKTLTATKDIAPAGSTLSCIFGCGGNRDPGKRPEMGSIVEAIADRVIVTSDDPRTEAPEAILDDTRDGMERPDRAEWIVVRRDYIRFAGRSLASGDIVLVAGKGHEPYQAVGTNRIHLDDREEVRRWFA